MTPRIYHQGDLGQTLAGLTVFLFLLFSVSIPTATVHAGDPTVDNALWILAQKTASAGQTRDARDAEIANQRLTATALDNQQRAIAIQQTQTAIAQTATAVAQNATATAEARATQTAQAQATATALAQQTATAQFNASATEQARQTATAEQQASATAHAQATATAFVVQAQATTTHLAVIAETDARNAQLVSGTLVVGVLIILVALAIALVRAAWQIKRPVIIVAEPTSAETPIAAESPAITDPEISVSGMDTVPVRIGNDDSLVSELNKLFEETEPDVTDNHSPADA